FAGAIFTYLYNFYCFAVRAVGDSYTPLIFLFASVIINGVLDVIFVIAFKWGIEGTALATVLAQMLSSVLCIIYTNKKFELLRLRKSDLKVDGKIVWEITSYSLSMSLQQVFVYVGRLAIQGLVNTYPENVVAGVNSGTRLDALLQTPMRGYTNALTTYTAQNLGAKKYKRVVDGYKASWLTVAVVGVLSTLITVLLAESMVKLFDSNLEVISAGKGYLVDIGWGYMLMCIIVQSQAVFKGIGMLKTFVVSTLISIIFRIGLSYLFEHFWGLDGMFWAPTASWIVGSSYCLIAMLIAYRKILLPLARTEISTEIGSV
ncbi:MAG: polysaccharide biosynthesis C-terminal domain-containing protein, partial [Clostridia bacterium]|nr:polysaccharide biosynthesis C-terminal domain-containing protein [Clostridia bacterium]